MRLENKRIVITGGTSGIGLQMVKQLYSKNQVVVISRSTEKLNKLCSMYEGVNTLTADLSRLGEVERVADMMVKRFGSIDVLINNAAQQHTPAFLDDNFEYESISREITINFTSICSLTYLLMPALLHQDRAVILNVNSGLALVPKTSSAIYCATKGALNIFSQSLRYQLEKTNVSVQQVFLELVDTAMTEGRGNNKMTAEDAAGRILDGVRKEILDHDIGKVRLLRLSLGIAPTVAKKIMRKY